MIQSLSSGVGKHGSRIAVSALLVAIASLSYDLVRPQGASGQSGVSYLVHDFYTATPPGNAPEHFAALVAPPFYVGNDDVEWHVNNTILVGSGASVIPRDEQGIPSGILGHLGPINTSTEYLYGVNIGSGAEVNDVFSQGSVLIGQNAEIDGDVEAAYNVVAESGSVVTGTVDDDTGGAQVKRPALAVAFPEDATQNVNVNSGQTVSLAPGKYATVNVNGTLNLEAGYYYFNEWTTGTSATLNFPATGNIVLHTRWRFIHNATISNIESVAPRLAVMMEGGGPAQINSRWAGTLFAPYDLIDIKYSQDPHLGMFMGNEIKLASNTQLKHVPLADFEDILPGFDVHGKVDASNHTCEDPLEVELRAKGGSAARVITSSPPTVAQMLDNLDEFISRLEALEAELD